MATVYVVRFPRLEDGELIWCVFDEKHRLDGTPNRSRNVMIRRFERAFKVNVDKVKDYGKCNHASEAALCLLEVQGE